MGLFDLFKKKETDSLGNTIGSDANTSDLNASSGAVDYARLNDSSPFRMTVENVFTITGRGTVVTGLIESGMIRIGDEVRIEKADGRVITTIVSGVEQFRKLLDMASAGENVGLLLRQVQRGEVEAGDIITK